MHTLHDLSITPDCVISDDDHEIRVFDLHTDCRLGPDEVVEIGKTATAIGSALAEMGKNEKR